MTPEQRRRAMDCFGPAAETALTALLRIADVTMKETKDG